LYIVIAKIIKLNTYDKLTIVTHGHKCFHVEINLGEYMIKSNKYT